MKRQRPQRPENTYESTVVALWPKLGDEDPLQHEMDMAYGQVTTNRQLNLQTGEWEPIPPSTTRPLMRIVCSFDHDLYGAPMLSEVWHTGRGPFFVSKLPGAVFDPPDHPIDPFAPPTVVLPKHLREQRRTNSRDREVDDGSWRPVPVTIVRLFLDEPNTAEALLWVKCADHGAATVDPVKLYRVLQQDQDKRRLHDTNRSGWFVLIQAIPLVGGIVMLVFECEDSGVGPNRYGPSPKDA